MISIELMAIMAIIGYMAFVFTAESFNPFFIPRLRRKRILHAVGITVAAMIASSPLVLQIWPKTGLREQLSLILLVLLVSLACLIVLYSIYYLYSRLFTQQADIKIRNVQRTDSEPAANLLTNKAGAPTKINREEDNTEPNTPPIEINADRMFDANLEAALESADADLKVAKANDTLRLNKQPQRSEARSVSAKPETSNFTHTDGVIIEAEWSEPATMVKNDNPNIHSQQDATTSDNEVLNANAAIHTDDIANMPPIPVSASLSAPTYAHKPDTAADIRAKTPAAPITAAAKSAVLEETFDAGTDNQNGTGIINQPTSYSKTDGNNLLTEPALPLPPVQSAVHPTIKTSHQPVGESAVDLQDESTLETVVKTVSDPTPTKSAKTANDGVQVTEIATALTLIKGKTTQLRSTIEHVSDQQIVGQQHAASLKQKQQEQLSIQRREINRQAHQLRELESRQQQRAVEMDRLNKLHSATDSLLQAQRDQLEEARRFRTQAERLLAAREEALQTRERSLETQRYELEKSRSVAKKAALAARKAALAHQQVKISMLREQVARNKTEKRAQKAVLIAKDAISRLANEEQRNKTRSTT